MEIKGKNLRIVVLKFGQDFVVLDSGGINLGYLNKCMLRMESKKNVVKPWEFHYLQVKMKSKERI